jgi:hemolysin activation/secretion protein
MLHNARNWSAPRLVLRTAIAALAGALSATAHAAQPLMTAAVIDGSTVYSAPELFPLYGDQLGKPITRELVRDVAAAVAARYQRDGYARPTIDVQDELAASGIVRLNVREPRITRVTIAGDPGPYRARLALLTARLDTAAPVRPADVQRMLVGMRALPGLSVAASTRRDANALFGQELLLDASFRPVDNMLRLTNRATEEIGPYFVTGQLVGNGLLGRGERLGLLFTAAHDVDEYGGAGVFGDFFVGSHGTRLMLMGLVSRSDPTEEPVDLEDLYRRQRTSIGITQPVQLESGTALVLSGGFDLDDQVIERDAADLRDDRLRILHVGARAGWRHEGERQTSLLLQLRKGLDGLGSQLEAEDLVDDPRDVDFLSARLQATHVAGLWESWTLRLDGFAQQSADVVPDSERFKIGGDRLGRGFEITEIAGDQGLGGKVELRRGLPAPSFLPGATEAYGFYDIGAAWRNDVPGRQSAATAGTGVALRTEHLTTYLELAKPLTHPDVEGDKDVGVFVELTLNF